MAKQTTNPNTPAIEVVEKENNMANTQPKSARTATTTVATNDPKNPMNNIRTSFAPNTTTVLTLNAVPQLAGVEIQNENDSHTHRRLVVFSTAREWDPATDFATGHTIDEATTALEAIAQFATGMIQGNSRLFLVAPAAKLFNAYGSGRMAYVRWDYTPVVDAIRIDMGDGNMLVLDVDPRDIPQDGYRRLRLVPNSRTPLVGNERETFDYRGTHTNGDNGLFNRLTTFSALLDRVNVSVSIGPKTLDRALGVIAVLESNDPVAANEARKHANRQVARVNYAIRDSEMLTAEAETAESSEFDVPLSAGGTVNLLQWPSSQPVHCENAAGLRTRPIVLNDDPASRLAVARQIQKEHLTVIL